MIELKNLLDTEILNYFRRLPDNTITPAIKYLEKRMQFLQVMRFLMKPLRYFWRAMLFRGSLEQGPPYIFPGVQEEMA